MLIFFFFTYIYNNIESQAMILNEKSIFVYYNYTKRIKQNVEKLYRQTYLYNVL